MFGLSPSTEGFLGGALAITIPLVFNMLKEIYFDKRKRSAERAYISVQLVFLLDKFTAKCAEVAWDCGYDQTYQAPTDADLRCQTQVPIFDMSGVKGEHKYLKPEMLAKLHSIEIKLNQANETLNDVSDNEFPDGARWEYFELRRSLYGEVGIYAALIAKDLRDEFKIETTHGWVPCERITQSFINLEETKAARDERIRQRRAERERRNA